MTDSTTAFDTESGLAAGRWEPCPTFAPDGAGSPVCGDCGWLDHDHARIAVVRRLPVRVQRHVQPRRLAS